MTPSTLTRALLSIASCSIALAGCAVGGEPANDVPAVLEQPTNATREELHKAVASIVGTTVTLAPDALTRDTTLSIERTPLRDASGRRIEVRERTGPELFRLFKRGDQCVLIHERTKTETILKSSRCVAQ